MKHGGSWTREMVQAPVTEVFESLPPMSAKSSKNPFAYFTQIIHYAFLRRIQKEKKQLDIKTKIIERSGFDEVMNVDDNAMSGSSSDYNTIKDNIVYKSSNR